MTIYRLHIRPKGGRAVPHESFAYCLKEQVLGLGWRVNSLSSLCPWENYLAEATLEYGDKELSRVKYFKKNVKPNDLIWTRNTTGQYYLARVLSNWEYRDSPGAKNADIVNVVRCQIKPVPNVDDVPGKVVACFRPTRTIQAIRNNSIATYSKFLWNGLVSEEFYDIDLDEASHIFSYLSAEETEDVIFIYLQYMGWILVPSSRRTDTMSYEYYAINKDSGQRAIVQVKTGGEQLDPSDWGDWKEKVFLFQSNGLYTQKGTETIECLEPSKIEEFLYDNMNILPKRIARWLEFLNKKVHKYQTPQR
ncbi:hypothetical protein [Vibrio coralliilyticus]|uniref:hypothetical protein n=1 Tax=Vibrio coralliilyticus TaxID=190893 RepID=UPI00148D1160|nr:hypothetical protein [Vibrio coralliilyticus]NOI29562.1 hypothetical protein [Vibrio coralliilyticus]NOI48779.1 hypothetical protein [Vibrio coralliilyticus]WFB49922.1 hypothetical protein P6988_24080 [Vibrio coralliilyticus]